MTARPAKRTKTEKKPAQDEPEEQTPETQVVPLPEVPKTEPRAPQVEVPKLKAFSSVQRRIVNLNSEKIRSLGRATILDLVELFARHVLDEAEETGDWNSDVPKMLKFMGRIRYVSDDAFSNTQLGALERARL